MLARHQVGEVHLARPQRRHPCHPILHDP
jgi:hypothetical protein